MKRVHVSTEHGSANQPRHTNPTDTDSPSPQSRLSVNSSSGIHRGLNSLPAFTSLSLQPKHTDCPRPSLTFELQVGVRIKDEDLLQFGHVLAAEGTLGSGEELLPCTESLSERGTGARCAFTQHTDTRGAV